jgi:transposase InsO family protein
LRQKVSRNTRRQEARSGAAGQGGSHRRTSVFWLPASGYVCGFSEILADLRLPGSRFFKGCRWLVWHYKNKANLGDDWGRLHESILHLHYSLFIHVNTPSIIEVSTTLRPYSN